MKKNTDVLRVEEINSNKNGFFVTGWDGGLLAFNYKNIDLICLSKREEEDTGRYKLAIGMDNKEGGYYIHIPESMEAEAKKLVVAFAEYK